MIPEALARALIAQGYEQAGGPTIVVGRVPEGWPAELVPPPPVTVLGGTSVASTLQAVFQYPADAEDPLDDFHTALASRGFTLPKMAFGEGFRNSTIVMLCRESLLAQVRVQTLDAGGAVVIVSLSPGAGICTGEFPGRPMRARDRMEMPLMKLPPGVKRSSGGGCCGGGDHTTHNISLITPVSCEEILAWYAEQLRAEGWTAGDSLRGAGVVTQLVQHRDSKGTDWLGALTVWENGISRDVFLNLSRRT